MPSLVEQVRTGAAEAAKPAVRWTLGHFTPRTAMRIAARHGDLQGRLVTETRDGDPYPLFEQIRAAGPLYKSRFAYVTASHRVVREVLSSNDFRTGYDVGEVSSAAGRAFLWAADTGVVGPLQPPSLLVTEPPDHTRYRRLVTRVFSVRAVEALRGRTEQIAAELLDTLERSGSALGELDLVESYCALLPVTVIAEILGVPVEDRERILGFGAAAAPSLDLGLSWRVLRRVESALAEFDEWLGGHLDRLRRAPGDDLLSQLVAAEDDGVGLTDRELKATAGLVLAAGFETTVNLLGNGTELLTRHRDQLDGLLADPTGWPNAVDEVLRFDPPVLLTGRTALRPVEVAGARVSKGALVTTVLAAANRDPEVFEDPHRFDVRRPNARDHVSFSAGRHYCLGAALARMEGEIGLRMLFERFPGLRTLPGSRRRDTRILRGYAHLPVQLGRSADRSPAAG